MKRVLIFSLLAVGVLSCSKDSFETKPSLEYKSSNTDIVPLGGTLRVELTYTDKEGDLDSVFLIRERLNKKRPVVMPAFKAPELSLPKDFTGATKADLVFILDYYKWLTVGLGLEAIPVPGSGGKSEPDTMRYRFVIKDKAKNTSDTASRTFIIIR
jgi:hypothetical protein